jgi:hypothetical protein
MVVYFFIFLPKGFITESEGMIKNDEHKTGLSKKESSSVNDRPIIGKTMLQ